jgi:hypothetical protein
MTNNRGRPSSYTPELAALICERLAGGETLTAICRDPDMPPDSTVRGWASDDVQGFHARYTRARDVGLARMADEILDLADTPREGVTVVEKPSGDEVRRSDNVERSREQIRIRQWLLSKRLPRQYGPWVEGGQSRDAELLAVLNEAVARARK